MHGWQKLVPPTSEVYRPYDGGSALVVLPSGIKQRHWVTDSLRSILLEVNHGQDTSLVCWRSFDGLVYPWHAGYWHRLPEEDKTWASAIQDSAGLRRLSLELQAAGSLAESRILIQNRNEGWCEAGYDERKKSWVTVEGTELPSQLGHPGLVISLDFLVRESKPLLVGATDPLWA